MAQDRNERSPSKQDVRSSVEAHEDSNRRRSRSVASIGARNQTGSFRSGQAGTTMENRANEDGWEGNVAYGIGAGRPDRLMSQVTVNGVEVPHPNAHPRGSPRRAQVFQPSPINRDLAQEDWGELNETNGTRRRDLANLRQQSPSSG